MNTDEDTNRHRSKRLEIWSDRCSVQHHANIFNCINSHRTSDRKKKWLNWYTAYMEYFSLRKDHTIPSHFPKLNTLRIPFYFNLPQWRETLSSPLWIYAFDCWKLVQQMLIGPVEALYFPCIPKKNTAVYSVLVRDEIVQPDGTVTRKQF